MIVHDYTSLAWDGAESAVDEFFADKPESVVGLPDGAGSAVIRKARPKDGSGDWMRLKRSNLFSEMWTSAAQDGIRPLLGAGWSNAEPWGVWGIGDSHKLTLFLNEPTCQTFSFEADVEMGLVRHRNEEIVTVVVSDMVAATWVFNVSDNRRVRTVEIPKEVLSSKPTEIHIAFNVSRVFSPVDVDAAASDVRKLSMGLRAIRRGPPSNKG